MHQKKPTNPNPGRNGGWQFVSVNRENRAVGDSSLGTANDKEAVPFINRSVRTATGMKHDKSK